MGRADEAYVGGHGEGHYGDHFFADAPMDQAAAAKNAALLHSSDTFMAASVPGSYQPHAQGDHQYDSDSPCSQFGGQSIRATLTYPQNLDSPNVGALPPGGQMLTPGGQMLTPGCAMIGGDGAKKARKAATAQRGRDRAAARARDRDARLRALEERNAKLEIDIAELTGKGEGNSISALTFHADVLKAKNAQLEGTVSALQTQNAELLSTNGALRGENAGYAGGADAVLQIATGAKAAAAAAEKEAKKRDARTKARERKVEQREEGAAAAQSAAEGTVFRLGEAVRLTAQLQRELGQAPGEAAGADAQGGLAAGRLLRHRQRLGVQARRVRVLWK